MNRMIMYCLVSILAVSPASLVAAAIPGAPVGVGQPIIPDLFIVQLLTGHKHSIEIYPHTTFATILANLAERTGKNIADLSVVIGGKRYGLESADQHVLDIIKSPSRTHIEGFLYIKRQTAFQIDNDETKRTANSSSTSSPKPEDQLETTSHSLDLLHSALLQLTSKL